MIPLKEFGSPQAQGKGDRAKKQEGVLYSFVFAKSQILTV
jgi:hypothetical protein